MEDGILKKESSHIINQIDIEPSPSSLHSKFKTKIKIPFLKPWNLSKVSMYICLQYIIYKKKENWIPWLVCRKEIIHTKARVHQLTTCLPLIKNLFPIFKSIILKFEFEYCKVKSMEIFYTNLWTNNHIHHHECPFWSVFFFFFFLLFTFFYLNYKLNRCWFLLISNFFNSQFFYYPFSFYCNNMM